MYIHMNIIITTAQEFTELSGAQWPEAQRASLPEALAVDA